LKTTFNQDEDSSLRKQGYYYHTELFTLSLKAIVHRPSHHSAQLQYQSTDANGKSSDNRTSFNSGIISRT
jgi:hypothetical protein